MERKIIWNKRPSKSLTKALKYISEDSLLQAERVEEGIISAIEELPNKSEKYPPDKYKLNNSGNFRAFELFNYRISYKITDKEIRILRIRHTKQKPRDYK